MKDKRVLFFAPDFFGYELQIKNKLENLGAIVDFYDDRASKTTLYKILIRLNPKFLKHYTHSYFLKIISNNKNKNYDYVFFIKCEAALENDLKTLKKVYSNAKFILYLYDSIKNIKFFDMKKIYFDEIYSFDLNDVKNINDLKLLPLFYLDCYKAKENESAIYKYDLSFIGTAHSDRPYIINQIRKELIQCNRQYYFMLYVQSKLIYFIKKMISSDFRELDTHGHITLKKMNGSEVSEIIAKSKTVLDIQHPRQTGLTMRTIELIGMKKKMITTNHHIKEYSFFNKNNIQIIDRKNIEIFPNFFDCKYKQLDKNIYDKYSLDSWIKEIFKLGEIK